MAHGCEHYKRHCLFIAPCCKKEYTCRICHNEAEDHELNRALVEMIKCTNCSTVQSVSLRCHGCDIEFGKYACLICRLYDDDISKGQFHCNGCGICRVGGKDNFVHCDKCGFCLSTHIKGSHKCLEKSSENKCPVCLDWLHTSREQLRVPRCSHLIHSECYKSMLQSGNYTCPLCGESYVDMKECWKERDADVAATPMPPEYCNTYVDILCRDCHKECSQLFHVLGLKCKHCGSYNTCRTSASNNDTN